MAAASTESRQVRPAPPSATEESASAEAEKRLLASIPRPTPVPVRRVATPESRVNDLLNLARILRDRGDTSTALTRLREAQVIAPMNCQIVSEMAMTYEKMGLTEKAIEQWRRIYLLGERAGIYYAAAEAKLQAYELPSPPAATPTPAPQLDGGLPPPEGPATLASKPLLSLGRVGTVDDTLNSQPLRRLKLRVPIQARPGAHVDVHDVVIQVFFYDQTPEGSIVETNANVSSTWASSPVDWNKPEPEVLEVEYAQPEPDIKSARTQEHRNYFGYVVRVYYKNDLNAMVAEPVKLLKQFPPPVTLPNSDLPQ